MSLVLLTATSLGGGNPAAATPPDSSSLSSPVWVDVIPGISFTRVQAARFCRGGSSYIGVVRLEPSKCRIEPYHETEFPGGDQASALAWQKRLQAPVIFNAGLYDDSRRHLGILKRERQDIGGIRHSQWKGVLVSDSNPRKHPRATLLDLSTDSEEDVSSYGNAVQTMMLFDREGKNRVRKTLRSAARTVLAQGHDGHLYIFVTEGHYTLWETAALLREAGWDLALAIALDGGSESALVVRGESVSYRSSDGVVDATEQLIRASRPLPAVIAVSPIDPDLHR